MPRRYYGLSCTLVLDLSGERTLQVLHGPKSDRFYLPEVYAKVATKPLMSAELEKAHQSPAKHATYPQFAIASCRATAVAFL